MTDSTTKQVTNYSVVIKGFFGRNRSVKLKVIHLKDVEACQPELTQEEVQDLVNQTLEAEKAKAGLRWRVVSQPEEITERSVDGGANILRIRSFRCFSATTVAEGTV